MATLSMRNIDPALKERLRLRASRHGRTIEAELSDILNDAVAADTPWHLGDAIRRHFARFRIDRLPARPDEPVRDPPLFERAARY